MKYAPERRRAAVLLLLAVSVFVSAAFKSSDTTTSIHECCVGRDYDHEPAMERLRSQDEFQLSISPRALAFGVVSFVLGLVIVWLIRKAPDKRAILKERGAKDKKPYRRSRTSQIQPWPRLA